jgi:hypothetical protein
VIVINRISTSISIVILGVVLVGCSVQVGGGPQSTPTSSGGPPPHAPAHGYRAKQHYYYYPGANVYFSPSRGVYFYLASDGAWKVSVSLPGSIKVKLGDRVSLELDTDRPYKYNAEHRAKYPPGQAKKHGGGPPGKKKKWK